MKSRVDMISLFSERLPYRACQTRSYAVTFPMVIRAALSAHRGTFGNIDASLVALSCHLCEEKGMIVLHAIYPVPPSSDQEDRVECIASSMLSDFDPDFDVIAKIHQGRCVDALRIPGTLIFVRSDCREVLRHSRAAHSDEDMIAQYLSSCMTKVQGQHSWSNPPHFGYLLMAAYQSAVGKLAPTLRHLSFELADSETSLVLHAVYSGGPSAAEVRWIEEIAIEVQRFVGTGLLVVPNIRIAVIGASRRIRGRTLFSRYEEIHNGS